MLTIFAAKFLGIQSPTPYQWRKLARQRLHNGMNFAYGGTGVFDTDVQLPNMTNQIDLLQKLMLPDSLYSKTDLQSSLVLVTLCGNDYSDLSTTGGSIPVKYILLHILIVVRYKLSVFYVITGHYGLYH